ncbi:septum formation family protein [Pseudonocardia hydrocarbonoxydans]|uniref:Septum formation-related domain-containing protein n=2 Tax=Pseudonocardia hydrocarbonoxydans TaxID=76726 RepID=A0A4Y3WWJ5_9PSEU|nr:hypothetical protein PHY01_47530 [Pseudonocardia hydrocarbonoxydans]
MNPIVRRGVLALAAGALLSVAACSGTSVLDLEVGQCITDETPEGEQVSTVPVVACTEPHVGEIYALPQLPDGAFPGDAAVSASAEQLCAGPDFQNFVGIPIEQTTLSVNFLLPSAETWAEGDREIVCIVSPADGTPATSSLRGAAI